MERLPREPDRPRPAEARIEGEVESSFIEIDMDQAGHIPLPDEIAWDNARLLFKKVGTYVMPEGFGLTENIQVYLGSLEYQDSNGDMQQADLSRTTSEEKPVLFTGTRYGFYAHDPLAKNSDEPFYVAGLCVEDLKESMSKLSVLWHELGHIAIYDGDIDLQLLRGSITGRQEDMPKLRKALSYADEMRGKMPWFEIKDNPRFTISRGNMFRLMDRGYRFDAAVNLFHERNAWAAGANISRRNDYPTGFKKSASYFDYARLCLGTYARHHRDNRFIDGFKK